MIHMVASGHDGDIRREGMSDKAGWDRLTMMRQVLGSGGRPQQASPNPLR